jgi:hypothetical protein
VSTSQPDAEIEADLRAARDGDLHRLTGFALTGFVFGRGIPHRIVPREHWEYGEGLSIGAVAELRCQCGVLHVVRLGATPQSCTCRRWFFFDGTDVWALLSPASSSAA